MSTVRTTVVVGFMLSVAGCAAPVEESMPTSGPGDAANPFFADNSLPYDLPPFDRIDDTHYLPAFERGMAEQLVDFRHVVSQAGNLDGSAARRTATSRATIRCFTSRANESSNSTMP